MINLSEDVQLNSTVIDIEAKDLDTTAKLRFFLQKNTTDDLKIDAFNENNLQIDSTPVEVLLFNFIKLIRQYNYKMFFLIKDWFEIDPNNGKLFTKSKIDREIAEIIYLIIGVEDLNAADFYKPQITLSNKSNF